MTSPSAQATTPVQWLIQPAPVRALSIPLARLHNLVRSNLRSGPYRLLACSRTASVHPRPLSLLAKFARSDPPGSPVPVLLGLESFLTHQAELTLRPPPQHGVLRLP